MKRKKGDLISTENNQADRQWTDKKIDEFVNLSEKDKFKQSNTKPKNPICLKDANNISIVSHCIPLPLKNSWKTCNPNCCNSQLPRKKKNYPIQPKIFQSVLLYRGCHTFYWQTLRINIPFLLHKHHSTMFALYIKSYVPMLYSSKFYTTCFVFLSQSCINSISFLKDIYIKKNISPSKWLMQYLAF